MSHMTAHDFEARYRANADPWSYQSSDYERDKYAATLDACGEGPFASALELGASIGVFSELLAHRCRVLTTVDVAPTAVATARRRLAGCSTVRVILGSIPDAIPPDTYDLVVASEILYYLPPLDLRRTLDVVRSSLADGGKLVAVHWRPPGPERPFSAAEIHARLRTQAWLKPVRAEETADYLLDVLERP
ncbi:MAG TPA: SAM-dependent methyltransferase [Solirubrobacteraceae bacterium]|jgi:SAM-dependent methyltransferase|nr:SAM-dependent methyltransferase [Solirubrobacteraceae bacterium]